MHHTYDVAGAEEVTTDERFSGIDIAKCKKKRKRRRRHQSADPRKDISAETGSYYGITFQTKYQTDKLLHGQSNPNKCKEALKFPFSRSYIV